MRALLQKNFILLSLAVAACAPAPSAPKSGGAPFSIPDRQPGALTADQEAAARAYAERLAVARANPAGMDWPALRAAYAASPYYNPAVGNGLEMQPVIAAMRQSNWIQAAALAEAAVARNWMDLPAHFHASIAYGNLGDTAASARHKAVVDAFVRDLLANGHNGRSTATAYQVLAIAEEYLVLGLGHAQRQQQSLITVDGHSYDVLDFTRVNPPGGGQMFFAVDTMFAREGQIAMGAALITEDQGAK